MADVQNITKEIKKFNGEEIEVLFRKVAPVTDPEARYPGFKQETKVLKKGYVHTKGALPLPCDIVFERDVPCKMRDGVTLYCNIFRPVGSEKVPAIITWAAYGKGCGYLTLDRFPGRMGVQKSKLSGLETFEGPDPAYWCKHGYAIVNVDSRGAFASEGDIYFWGSQDAQDGYDFIEWLATQSWCNGKIGMTGNSWLAIAQWFIASLNPPHLAAIAPWEGVTDLYRQDICLGGIPDPSFNETILTHLYGNSRVEDIPAMLEKYPLMNAYWEDKIAKLEKITAPAYIVASYTNPLHTIGTFKAFREISSREKWLRIHNNHEWYDYYTEESTEDLRRFFDYYLKGVNNNWPNTPRVRMSVLVPGGKDIVGRVENEFPPRRAVYEKLYLDASNSTIVSSPVTQESSVSYQSDDGKSQVTFTYRFNSTTEVTGYIKLKLWVEAKEASDMDIYVTLQKLNKNGKRVGHKWVKIVNPVMDMMVKLMYAMNNKKFDIFFYSGPNSRLRISRRQLDAVKSTETEPYYTFKVEEPLDPGQVVPVEIAFPPTSILYHAGEYLRVVITGYSMVSLRSMMEGMPPEKIYNKGVHVIHTGGKYDSHILIPEIRG